jgi:LacI family transcriptional regulator
MEMSQHRNITIKDVARELCLSVSSVSRALNDKPDISDETKTLIIDTANRLGYVPNRLAASLRHNSTGSIGIIVPEIDNLYFSEIIAGIEKVAQKKSYDIILASTNEDVKREIEVTKFLIEKRVDGIIAMPSRDDDKSIDMIKNSRIPYVCVARRMERDESCSYVVNDDEKCGFIATEHLIEKGHTRILFLNGVRGNYSARKQLQGYKRALKTYSLPFDSALIEINNIQPKDGYKNINKLISSGLEFTGVICFSDMIALGAAKAIKENGRRIPEDIAIVGCDNIQFVEFFDTPLTTVDLAKSELGVKAAQILIQKINKESTSPKHVVFEPKLVIRKTT